MSTSNKAKYGDMLRMTSEALTIYIGVNFGEEAAKEFANGTLTVRTAPVVDPSIFARHAAKVLAHTTRINTKIVALEAQIVAIKAALVTSPNDFDMISKKIDTEDKLAYAQQVLGEEPETLLTMDVKAVHSNAHRTFREDEHKALVNRGKVYTLILGQCTQVLKDKLKEDSDWARV
jgi:hypothetical protein